MYDERNNWVDPPFTRQKYLEYFRPLQFGQARLKAHGGDRQADVIMAEEISRVYLHNPATESTGELAEDELWEENLYRGAKPKQENKAAELVWRRVDAQLDALIAEELRYDPAAAGGGWLAPLRSKQAYKAEPLGARANTCPALEAGLQTPMAAQRTVMFILGTQKGGTTYLFNALTKHRAFVGADHAYGQKRSPWAKEVHFFNRWPLPTPSKKAFMTCFPSRTWKLPKGAPRNYTLVDATPDYMFNSLAPPRILAMWPQAKFVVLLRDPVARAYSAWKMSKKAACKQQARKFPDRPCDFPSFGQMVVREVELLKSMGCTFSRKGLLYPKTWGDCYRCKVTFTDPEVCADARQAHREPCDGPPFLTLSVSTYAAQLAWWLRYFPLDRFKFVFSHDLHGGNPVPALNSIIDFMGLEVPPFHAGLLRNVWGYDGGYNTSDLTQQDRKAAWYLRLFYRQAQADLAGLLQARGLSGEVPDELDTRALLAGSMPDPAV